MPDDPSFDPMAPDAPLVVLLDKRNLLGKTPDELREIVRRCRTMIAQPQTLKASLKAESDKATSGKPKAASQTKKALDLLGELGL